MTCPRAARSRIPKVRPTWEMSREDLARIVAEHRGVHVHTDGGGWLYRADEVPLMQGWTKYARRLEASGIIKVGVGINWPLV